MFKKFFSGIKYGADVRNEIEKALGKAESARLFDMDSVILAVEAFHKDKISVQDAAGYMLIKLKYEPKTREQIEIRNRLVQFMNDQGLDISSINPEVFYKLVAIAISKNDVEGTAEWFLDLLGTEMTDEVFLAEFRKEAARWLF